ncbi:hypothetical protein HK101_009133 [Irineochytrium annulatum]|nr:hypothetical protein HK101_009133 [Irineochytrium annulatum]
MSELELMPSARDEAVRRLIGRAKLYTWVGETLLQGKPSKTVIYGRLFASGRDGGESLEKDGVPIRVEDLKQF